MGQATAETATHAASDPHPTTSSFCCLGFTFSHGPRGWVFLPLCHGHMKHLPHSPWAPVGPQWTLTVRSYCLPKRAGDGFLWDQVIHRCYS